jgi:hypothetical protein
MIPCLADMLGSTPGDARLPLARVRPFEGAELGLEVQHPSVLARRGGFVVDAKDRVVRGLHDLGQLVAIPPPPNGG